MAADKIHSGLFTASGCCSETALQGLASGVLDAEQALEVRAHLAGCNLCREAAEGLEKYLLHNDMAGFKAQVSSINMQVAAKSGYQSGLVTTAGKKPGSGRFWFFFTSVMVLFVVSALVTIRFSMVPAREQTRQATPVSRPGLTGQQTNPAPKSEGLNSPAEATQASAVSQKEKAGMKPKAQPVPGGIAPGAGNHTQAGGNPARVVWNPPIEETNPDQEVREMNPGGEVFVVVEKQPQYPGGEEARLKFFSENLHYPDQAKEQGIQGKVYVTFIVETDGMISDIRVVRGIGGGCDEEAIRVVKSMDRWNPGSQRGIPVRVQFTLPVKFTLQ